MRMPLERCGFWVNLFLHQTGTYFLPFIIHKSCIKLFNVLYLESSLSKVCISWRVFFNLKKFFNFKKLSTPTQIRKLVYAQS